MLGQITGAAVDFGRLFRAAFRDNSDKRPDRSEIPRFAHQSDFQWSVIRETFVAKDAQPVMIGAYNRIGQPIVVQIADCQPFGILWHNQSTIARPHRLEGAVAVTFQE